MHGSGAPFPVRCLAATVVLLFSFVLLSACGEDGTAPDDTEADYPAVEVSPARAAPGTPLTVVSAALAGDEPLALRIDGRRVPLTRAGSGPARTVVPILAAGPAGGTPPAAAVVVELIAGEDSVVARSENALTVLAVPSAPGAADSLLAVLERLAGATAGLRKGAAPATAFTAVSGVVSAALDSLLLGESEYSLATALGALAATDPETVLLLEGVLASSGVLESTRELASRIERIESPEQSGGTAAPWVDVGAPQADGVLDDLELARQMQLYSVFRLVGETVIGETSSDYGDSVGLVAGALVGISIPLAGLLGSILSVVDFAVNRVALGIYPAELTRFELVLEDTLLSPGDTTTARIDITAINDPPETSFQELIDLVLAGAGLADGVGDFGVAQTAREYLEALYEFFLDQVRDGINQIADEYPSLDPGFAVVPALEWTSVANDPRLYELVSQQPGIVAPLDSVVNWAARDSASGETAIYARVATGPDAVLIDPPPGFPYTGGAFGEEVRATETRTITVLSELLLEVELPSTLANDDLGALEVRAGHADVDGEPVWKPGIAIEILTDGGSVQQATGTTDVDGQFVTLAQLDPGSEEIIITVTARDSAGQEAVRSVEAGSGDASVWPLSESWAYEGFVGISLDPPHEDHNRESVHLDSASSVSGDRDDEWTDVVDGDTIQYRSSGSVSSSWSITYGEGGTLKELSTHAAVSAQASWEVLSGGTAEASHGARSIAGVEMYFQVVDGPAVLTIEVTGTGGLAIHPEIDDPVFVTSGVETVTLPAGRYYLTAGAQADAAASATGTHASDTATAEASATVTFSGGG